MYLSSATAQLDANTPKCPTNGLLADPEFECNGLRRVAVLVELGGMAHLFSGELAHASRALDAVAIEVSIDSCAVNAVGDDEVIHAGAAHVILDETRNLVLSESPLMLSRRLGFCFDSVTMTRSQEKFPQVACP